MIVQLLIKMFKLKESSFVAPQLTSGFKCLKQKKYLIVIGASNYHRVCVFKCMNVFGCSKKSFWKCRWYQSAPSSFTLQKVSVKCAWHSDGDSAAWMWQLHTGTHLVCYEKHLWLPTSVSVPALSPLAMIQAVASIQPLRQQAKSSSRSTVGLLINIIR